MANKLAQMAADIQDAYHYARELQGKDGGFEGTLRSLADSPKGLMQELSHMVVVICSVVLEYGAIWAPKVEHYNFKSWGSKMEKHLVRIADEVGVDPWNGTVLKK